VVYLGIKFRIVGEVIGVCADGGWWVVKISPERVAGGQADAGCFIH